MRSDRGWRWPVLAAAALTVAACSGNPAPATSAPATGASPQASAAYAMLRTELYFERVALAGWEDFLAGEVTPRFPDGLTWFDVNGQWRGPSGGPEKMASRLLIVLHADNAHNEQALHEIATRFHARFGSNVLVVSQPARARDADWTTQRLQGNRQLSPAPAEPAR